jgi:hypothetical protein
MQRSYADLNSPFNENAELTRGALELIPYSEALSGKEIPDL